MKNIKKVGFLIVLICTLVSFSSCSKTPENYIKTKTLSKEQEEIINLLPQGKLDCLMFEYKTEDTYKNVEFWVDVYKKGKLIDTCTALNFISDEPMTVDGDCVVIISELSDFLCTITCTESSGGKYTSGCEPNKYNFDYSAAAYYTLNDPVQIEDGKEIALYGKVYTNDNRFKCDEDILVNINDYLDEYDFSYLVKCKFSK